MRCFITQALLLTLLLMISEIYSYDTKLVLGLVKSLEPKIQTDLQFKDADYAIIVERLDELDLKLYKTLKQSDGFKNVDKEFSYIGFEQMKDIAEDVKKIERAFREVKIETSRIRREIPKIENDISSVKEDVKNYCIANTNNTQELLHSVRLEVVQQGNESSAEFHSLRSLANSFNKEHSKSVEIVQKIDEKANKIAKIENALIDLANSVNKEHSKSLEIVQKIDENAIEIAKIENALTDPANSVNKVHSKLLEIVQKIDENNDKIANIENALTDLSNSVNKEHSKSVEIVQKIDENAEKIANIENALTDLANSVNKEHSNSLEIVKKIDENADKNANVENALTDLANSVNKEHTKSVEIVQKIDENSIRIAKIETVLTVLANSVNKEHSKSVEIVQKIDENAIRITKIENTLTDLSSILEYLFSLKPIRSCADGFLFPSGVYKLYNGPDVYCDQTTDGGGWIVFQRRTNGEVDFYRNWTEYKNGFGNLDGEFWLGNENLYKLTKLGGRELRIEMEDFDGNKAYAKYSKFKIHPEHEKYRLEVSGYSGNAGDSLSYHNGMSFTTFDRDNDGDSVNCAKSWHGAWWYNSCHHSNLNGKYYNENGKTDYKGVNWYHWKKGSYCLKQTEMKLR